MTEPLAVGLRERTQSLLETDKGPPKSSYSLTVSRIQREPQGDGTALPPGDSLHSVWVLSTGRESHSPSTLGLHLCLWRGKR